jgi:hypothetical protein
MKRRHFLTLSTLATAATGASAAEPREEWWDLVEKRFWRDLGGFDIQTIPMKPALLPDEGWRYEDFLSRLRQPRLILSAEGGTALIEWERPEECDSRSTTRWIISRSGAVLRHRHEPPHEC